MGGKLYLAADMIDGGVLSRRFRVGRIARIVQRAHSMLVVLRT